MTQEVAFLVTRLTQEDIGFKSIPTLNIGNGDPPPTEITLYCIEQLLAGLPWEGEREGRRRGGGREGAKGIIKYSPPPPKAIIYTMSAVYINYTKGYSLPAVSIG